MAPDLILLALDYYRTPLRFSRLADPEQPLPESFEHLVGAFGGALSPRNIEHTAAELGTGPAELQHASSFFLRHVLLAPRSNHYRVLGVSPGASEETIRQHYHLLVRIFHPDRLAVGVESDAALTARINEAYRVLKNPILRRRYDQRLSAGAVEGRTTVAETKPLRPRASVRSRFFPRFARRERNIQLSFRRRRQLLVSASWGLAISSAAALAVLLASRQPLLEIKPHLADESLANPSFIGDPFLRMTGQSGSEGEQSAKTSGGADREVASAILGKIDGEDRGIFAHADTLSLRPAHPPSGDASRPGDGSRAGTISHVASSLGAPRGADLQERERIRAEARNGSALQEAPREPSRASSSSQSPAKIETTRTASGEQSNERVQKTAAETLPTAEIGAPARPEELIQRLIRCYQAGDSNDLAALFTEDARVNNGSGRGFIRADYAKLFAEAPERRLSIEDLRWSISSSGRLVGRGTYRARVNDGRNAVWHFSSGELMIELVPWMSGFKISKMIHH